MSINAKDYLFTPPRPMHILPFANLPTKWPSWLSWTSSYIMRGKERKLFGYHAEISMRKDSAWFESLFRNIQKFLPLSWNYLESLNKIHKNFEGSLRIYENNSEESLKLKDTLWNYQIFKESLRIFGNFVALGNMHCSSKYHMVFMSCWCHFDFLRSCIDRD